MPKSGRRNQRDRKTGDPLSPSGRDLLADSPDSQAKRVLLRFGGVQNFLNFLLRCGVRRSQMSVYHWVYNGGIIPPNGVRDVFLAERQAGIRLTDEDWSPYMCVEASTPAPPPPIEHDPTWFKRQVDGPDTPPETVEASEEAPPPQRKWVL